PLLQRMQILGDIAQMQEIAEGADDGERFARRQLVEEGVELGGGLAVVAARGYGEPANRLDALEGLLALVLAHGLAEQTSKQAHVLMQAVIAARRLRPERVSGVRRRLGGARGERGGFRDLHGMRTSFGARARCK